MSDFKIDYKHEDAVLFIQKVFRKKLAKMRLKKARRIPGYMNATGTVKMCGLWLVFIMRANADLTVVKLTLKERTLMKTIVDKKVIADNIHQLGEQQGATYKL